jgi:hypothetical protein
VVRRVNRVRARGVCALRRRLLLPTVGLLAGSLLAAGFGATEAAAGVCANDAVRAAALPDCRAYELVSPPFEFGQPPTMPTRSVAADGASVAFSSVGGFGETANDASTTGSGYVARRGDRGWSSEPLDPSGELFQGEETINSFHPTDMSRDLRESVFAQAPAAAKAIDIRLYIRSAGGATREVGPTVPAAAVAGWTRANGEALERPDVRYAGSSADLSRALFYSRRDLGGKSFLWPGDSTVGFLSLYEYVGSSHTGAGGDAPALVALDGSGRLLGQCGVTLGASSPGGGGSHGASVDSYNAISQDGRMLFFTVAQRGCTSTNASGEQAIGEGPAVNELFARLEGSPPVAISEPSKADCSECDTSEAAAREARFQGASRDGSKAFFVSEQRLLSGAGGLAPQGLNLYEYDFRAQAGKRVTLVAANIPPAPGEAGAGVMRVTENGDRVYFVSSDRKLADNPDARGKTAEEEAGEQNMYAYDTVTGRYTFVAALGSGDRQDWQANDARPVEATPDGRFLLFASSADLTPDSAGSGTQLYRYDARAGERGEPGALTRISIGEGGFNQDGNVAAVAVAASPSYSTIDLAVPPPGSITDDGSKVFFSSNAALTSGALNDACALVVEGACSTLASNVYEYENGHIHLISDGQDRHAVLGGSAVTLIGANPSGSDVFFTTADRLVAEDTDTQTQIYDARVDGGFPAPSPSASCSSDCQAPPGAPPGFTTPASALVSGDGNLTVNAAALPTPRPKLTRAQLLVRALRACRSKRDSHKRAICQAQARRKYGPARRVNKRKRNGKS